MKLLFRLMNWIFPPKEVGYLRRFNNWEEAQSEASKMFDEMHETDPRVEAIHMKWLPQKGTEWTWPKDCVLTVEYEEVVFRNTAGEEIQAMAPGWRWVPKEDL